jgi:phosphoribosylformylglycinamidine (FGAM) synthase-like enzyme
VRTMDFKEEGDKIMVIGRTYHELDGSEYQRSVHGLVQGSAPKIRMDEEMASANAVRELVTGDVDRDITAIHDCSAGGIGIALAEMAIKSGLGAQVDISVATSEDSDDFTTLFSESYARYIITVKSNKAEDVLSKINAPAAIIGEVKGNNLVIDEMLDVSVEDLQNAYHGVIEKFMA